MLLLLIERAGWIEPSVYFNDCIARYEGQSFIPVHWTDTKGGLCLLLWKVWTETLCLPCSYCTLP